MNKGDRISGHFCIECLPFVDGAKASSGNPYKTDFCLMCGHRREGVDSTAVVGDWSRLGKTPIPEAILTVEPEPCDDCKKLAGNIFYQAIGVHYYPGQHARMVERIAEAIDAYASRLAQEARADERRRCAARAIDYLRKHRFDEDEGVGLCAAILQGTEPTKVSEDVERDIETVRDAIMAGQYRIDDGDDTHEALTALDRLVARLKEGNRGH